MSYELKKHGVHVDILHLFQNDNFNLDFDLKFIPLRADQKSRFWDLRAFRDLSKIIKEGEYDIVQTNAGDTLKYAVLSKFIFGWNAKLVVRNANRMSSFLRSRFQRRSE